MHDKWSLPKEKTDSELRVVSNSSLTSCSNPKAC